MSLYSHKKNYNIEFKVLGSSDLSQIKNPKPGYRVYVFEEQKYYFWNPINETWAPEIVIEGGGGGVDYTLPVATSEELGGIKLGPSFSLDENNQLLNNSEGLIPIIQGTRSEFLSLLSSDSLVPGQTYKITDRGDRGIFVTALSTNSISPIATRIMLCPANYSYTNSVWKGIWHIDRTFPINTKVIWGGMVWNHLTTDTGTSLNLLELDNTNWELVSKTDFTNEYTEKIFGCRYDVVNDWIERQWDGHGNEFGCSKLDSSNFVNENFSNQPFPINFCDVSDWNFTTRTGGQLGTDSAYFSQNRCIAVFNNFSNAIVTNSNTGMIINNYTENIRLNTNSGDIIGNKCSGIFCNGGSGRIINNTCGVIYSNTGCTIRNNTIPGDIISNWSNDIYDNTNSGHIKLNFCGELIWNNSNNGDIMSNYCSGILALNSNDGHISFNYNSGEISTNSNLGNIINNRNNGNINFITSEVPCNIQNNMNNGDITGGFTADVTDTSVDKVGI